jgi:hypothetical protein
MLNSQTIWKKVMTKKTRRRYTAEFKAAAVARLDEPGETLSSVAQALGVAATQVKTWRLEQQAAGSAEAVARRRAEGFCHVWMAPCKRITFFPPAPVPGHHFADHQHVVPGTGAGGKKRIERSRGTSQRRYGDCLAGSPGS